ncbi:MAG: tRNA-dihydrouridine synthase family protein, partial [Cardiobacteriaceae bacterium]|nr:tRNA-dihydrouridine synthase family protein [Cardiobacteriaceae bacterium]
MPIHLGAYHYNHPVIVLAPMAGISDLPFRRLCQENGADYSVAEMVSAKPDLLHTAYAENRLRFDTDSRYPKIIQLVGGDPALMAEAAMLMQARGADVIDINMGCPAKSVAKQLAGSALLADLKQVEKILNKVVHAVNIPVTLKTRLGYHDAQPNLSEVAMIAEDNGISA